MQPRRHGLIVRKGIPEHLERSRGLMDRKATGGEVMIEGGAVQQRADGRDGLPLPSQVL